jgi:hypothetical protein
MVTIKMNNIKKGKDSHNKKNSAPKDRVTSVAIEPTPILIDLKKIPSAIPNASMKKLPCKSLNGLQSVLA